MKPVLIDVKPLQDYHIFLQFDDDTKGTLSLKHLAHSGLFTWWDQADNFFKVYVDKETNAVAWNEDIDLDTFNLYLKLKGISFHEWQHQNETAYAAN